MIFYHNQLMKNENQLWLYLVSNPVPFERFEDHEAGLQIQLYELIERAVENGEDPVMLIEEILGITFWGGETTEEIGHFLVNTEHLYHAMHQLRENWNEMDDTLPEESLEYSSGTTKEQATQLFTEINLRTYLEALSNVFNLN